MRRYKIFMKNIPQDFMKLDITTIDKIKLQQLINDYAFTHSPKTLKNFYGFISSVIGAYTDKRYKIILPPIPKSNAYIPTKDEVKKILDHSKDTPYEIPILLATYGMRIGEIKALTLDDISDGEIDINKTHIFDEHYHPLIKAPKTVESTRKIKVPTYITDLIKQKREIYKGSYTAINRFLYRTQDHLKIKRFSIHKLRHFFATELYSRNISSKHIQQAGGWATDSIMKSVYIHVNKPLEAIDLLK